MPHRHRHHLASPTRRPDDRTRLLTRCSDRGAADLVYTGIGALCWLPDIRRWAQTVCGLLRPGGRLFIREICDAQGEWHLNNRPERVPLTYTVQARKR